MTTAQADELLTREYELFKQEVLRTVAGKLAASGVQIPEVDLEAFYNEAWHALYMKLAAGEEVENRKGLLVTIAHRRALNEHRSARPSRRADADELGALGADPDVEARLDDEARLRQLVEGMRERLDERQRQAAALCYLYDYSRPEAARAIGVTPKRMEKIMDGVSKQVRRLIGEIEAGARCSQYASLLRAYAVGLLDEQGERYRLARDHLDACSACRRQVLLLRGIAAVTPPAPLLLAPGGAADASAGTQIGPDAGSPSRGARHASRLGRKAIATGAAAAVAVAALAAAALTSDDGDAPPSRAPAVSGAAGAPSAGSGTARSRTAPKADRKARARSAAARRRARPQPAAPAPQATPVESTPTQTSPPPPSQSVVAAPSPTPSPTETPSAPAPPATEEPVRDGAEEFELR